MPVDPVSTLLILREFAIGTTSSLTSQALWEASSAAWRGLWHRQSKRRDLFNALWSEVAASVEAPWSPELRRRIARMRGAFSAGQVPDEIAFRALLEQNDIDPDAAPAILSEVERLLNQALHYRARTDPEGFQPAVLDQLDALGLKTSQVRVALSSAEARLCEFERTLDRIDQQSAYTARVIDEAVFRSDRIRPAPFPLPRQMSEDQIAVIESAAEAVQLIPDTITHGRLVEAERALAPHEAALEALLMDSELPEEVGHSAASLLSWVQIQRGTAALRRHNCRQASEIYQRASVWAQRAEDTTALRTSLHQTGVALFSARDPRAAKGFFARAHDLEPPPGSPEMLGNLAACLDELGEHRESLIFANRAIEAWQLVMKTGSLDVRPQLTSALNSRSITLHMLGRTDEALADADEAVALARELAQLGSPEFRNSLAHALNTRSIVLGKLKRHEDALAGHNEALQLYQALAGDDPDGLKPYVAMARSNRTVTLSRLEQSDECIAENNAVIQTYREMVRSDPDAFLPELAIALHNRGTELVLVGRKKKGLADLDEALRIRRDLAQREPQAFLTDVAITLTNRGIAHKDLGHTGKAIADLREASTIYAKLVEEEPFAHGDEPFRALLNLIALDDAPGHWAEIVQRLIERRGLSSTTADPVEGSIQSV